MSDAWQGLIGKATTGQQDAIWLYRTGQDTHGPVSAKIVSDKWIEGVLDAQTPLARLGTDFSPLGQVAAFASVRSRAEAAAARRDQHQFLRRAAVGLAMVVLIGAATAAVVGRDVDRRKNQLQREQIDRQKAARNVAEVQARAQAEAQRQTQLAYAASHSMKLVALVSLTGLQDVKITAMPTPASHRSRRRERRHRGSESAGDDAAGAAADDAMLDACQLTQTDVFTTLRAHLAKLNVCLEDEKRRDSAKLMPTTLELQFVVRTSGNVTELSINDRLFRSGPLNNCLVRAFKTIQFSKRQGADCPVTVPIKIGT